MNPVHSAIISHIREASTKDTSELAQRFTSMSDEQMIRRMFSNYRGERGLRLTSFGLQVMRRYFRGYEITIPEDEELKPMHLIFLDGRAKMPYYFDLNKHEIVVYEQVLGVKLRLVDGRLSILMEIEIED